MVRRLGGAVIAATMSVALVAGFGAAAPVWAAPADPAAATVDGLDGALLSVMKQAKPLGYQGRYHALLPAVQRAFDIPTMIRFAVGPSWAQIPAAQQQQLTDAFTRLTAASYAHNFNGWSGESFTIDPAIQTRGQIKLLTTHIVAPHGSPTTISYRLQPAGGAWKIVDVYYGGSISQLTTRRADFAATLAQGGAAALIAHLNQLVERQAN
jgi:phospholipid transport system substrate-binding protein